MSAQPDNVTPLLTKPSVVLVYVSPTIAERWLARNDKNRLTQTPTIKKYARDMAAGRWQLSGETVKFGPAGELLDGQHRLLAIIESGATVPLFVARGIPTDAQRVMDSGRARTAADALTLRGDSHASLQAAAARLALGVLRGAVDVKAEVSHSEIEAFIDANPGLLHAAELTRSWARKVDCPPAVVAFTYFTLAQIDTFEAAQFWTAAAEKVGLRDGDPVIAMTNRFAEARRSREVLSKRAMLSVIYRAWNARRSGRPLRTIRVNSSRGGLVDVPTPR